MASIPLEPERLENGGEGGEGGDLVRADKPDGRFVFVPPIQAA
jgi:hypothetical protein